MASKKKTSKKPAAKKAAAKKKPVAKKAAKKPAAKKKPAKKAASKKKAAKKPAKQVAAKPAGPVPAKKPVVVTPKNTSTKQFTQNEFFESVKGTCGFPSKKEAKEFYEAFTGLLQQALKSGYKIALPGLGKLQVRKTKARMGINPMTRERIKISARKRVRFTPNKALKTAVL